jgi:serine/threonine protein kinase
MVCDYPSVQREMNVHEVISKTAKISDASGKQHVRQALDHFKLSQGDRNYHFLIHAPLGVTLKLFLDMSRGSLPISYIQELTYQILHPLNFIHSTQVIHAGPTLPLLRSVF